eukprot:7918267-Ditylum_brightwellii.AAC.1
MTEIQKVWCWGCNSQYITRDKNKQAMWDDQCLVEMIDACEDLAELERVIKAVLTKGEHYSG